jgi:hypothetical protein
LRSIGNKGAFKPYELHQPHNDLPSTPATFQQYSEEEMGNEDEALNLEDSYHHHHRVEGGTDYHNHEQQVQLHVVCHSNGHCAYFSFTDFVYPEGRGIQDGNACAIQAVKPLHH